MQKILVCLLGIICFSCAVSVGAAEFEINLIRNATFKPGMDGQGPRNWNYYTKEGKEAGRGQMEFFDQGMTVEGPASMSQLEMFDDVTPGYRLSCRMKSEGKPCLVTMRARKRKESGTSYYRITNRKLDVWEDLTLDVFSTNHYGFNMHIRIPEGARMSIRDLRVTPILPPADDAGGTMLIADGDQYIPVRGIRLPAEPNWLEQLAAHEIRVNSYLISGVVLPVFTDNDTADEKGFICIDNLKKRIPDHPASRGEPGTLKEPEANGFRITCADGTVRLTGGNDAGVLAGAVHLSELLGAKFYAPRVFSIKTNRKLKVPAMDIARQPAFEWADGNGSQYQTWTLWKYGFLHSESCVAPCDKASPPIRAGWVHPPPFLAPPYRYAISNPEYYALVKGKRLEDMKILAYLNLCLGNPGLHKVVAERITRLMDLYPRAKYFSIGQGDGTSWCECDLCKALDEDADVLTDRLVAYANAVAAITSQTHPDGKLLIMAYGAQREDLPLREKLHPNVCVMYAFWKSSWPIWGDTFCKQNERGLKLLDDWNTYTGTNLTLFLYPVNTYENAEKIKLAAKKGIRGFYQCGFGKDFPETIIYTTGRLIWDPEADVDAMIDEIMPHIYGAATPFMREYFDQHHAFIRKAVTDPELWGKYFDKLAAPRMLRLPAEYAEPALTLLQQAEFAVEGAEDILPKIYAEQWRVLLPRLNLKSDSLDTMTEEQFVRYAGDLAKLVSLGRTLKKTTAFYRVTFPDWLYRVTAGALDVDRDLEKWHRDPKIDLFLADPVQVLRKKVYFQTAVEGGLEWPAEAWLGSHYFEKYMGEPGVVLRRKSSPESRVRACFHLEAVPAENVELQVMGLDNEKKEISEIEIQVNDTVLFAGPVTFSKNKWEWRTYALPRHLLKAGENVIVIKNTTEDYKEEVLGQAGPADEALARDYNWGWCMVGATRLTWNGE